MKYIFYGSMEVKSNVLLQKPLKNYSNGSASQFEKLTTKRFERESKKLQKILQLFAPNVSLNLYIKVVADCLLMQSVQSVENMG